MGTNSVECLLCHTAHVKSFAGNPTHYWQCARCGQRWDDQRVATVMSYKRWLKATMTIDNAA